MNRVLKGATMLALVIGLLCCAACALADTVTTTIPVRLSLTGDTPPSTSNFTFVLLPTNAGNPMPANSTLTISGAGSGAFGPISYSEPNDYVYTLYQTSSGVTGYTYDARIYTVTVQITSDAAGRLTATVYLKDGSGNKPSMAVFENSYHVKTPIPKTGYETASNGAWALLLGWCVLLTGARRWQATR